MSPSAELWYRSLYRLQTRNCTAPAWVSRHPIRYSEVIWTDALQLQLTDSPQTETDHCVYDHTNNLTDSLCHDVSSGGRHCSQTTPDGAVEGVAHRSHWALTQHIQPLDRGLKPVLAQPALHRISALPLPILASCTQSAADALPLLDWDTIRLFDLFDQSLSMPWARMTQRLCPVKKMIIFLGTDEISEVSEHTAHGATNQTADEHLEGSFNETTIDIMAKSLSA
ncbi:hypothetical protein R6Q59_010048 [Mikania micrantha]